MTDKDKAAGAGKDAGRGGHPSRQKIRFGIRLKVSLAIILLVSIVIFTIAAFIVVRESRLLTDQIFDFTKREVIHLANTVQQSVGVDELALSDAVSELRSFTYFKYVFVLNADNEVLFYFDRRGDSGQTAHERGRPLNDQVSRKLDVGDKPGEIMMLSLKDADTGGQIYEFSRLVMGKLRTDVKVGAVIIGMSDGIIVNEINRVKRLITYIFLGYLGVSVVASVILATIIIRPIKKLSHGATLIGQGDFSHRIEVNTSDELGRLASEFNIMTEMIQDAREKEIESRIMNEQLEMARDIQEGLNPMGYYEKGGVQIKGFTRAARGVGGDYFDYIDIDENRVGALISDVSGKGVPASLVMVMIRTVFTSYITRKDIDCASVVRAINDSLSADFAIDKFATLFFMIYDRATEELSFSNAGHGPLFCYRAQRHTCTKTTLDGVPIGIMEDVEYKQAKVKINPGDMVILYTDGITEMRNPEQEEYGLARVHKLMLDHNSLNAEDFASLLVEDVEKFQNGAPPHDDMTLLVFKRES
jgi:sigma-B regulation protein RsbU (phosphoserine phosphatase)